MELINARFSALASKVPGAQRQGDDGKIVVPAQLFPYVLVADPILPENQFNPVHGGAFTRKESSVATWWENVGQPGGLAFTTPLGNLSPGIWRVTINWFYQLTLGAVAADVTKKTNLMWFPALDDGTAAGAVENIFENRRVANVPGVCGSFVGDFSFTTDVLWQATADVPAAAGAGYFEVWQGHFLAQRIF